MGLQPFSGEGKRPQRRLLLALLASLLLHGLILPATRLRTSSRPQLAVAARLIAPGPAGDQLRTSAERDAGSLFAAKAAAAAGAMLPPPLPQTAPVAPTAAAPSPALERSALGAPNVYLYSELQWLSESADPPERAELGSRIADYPPVSSPDELPVLLGEILPVDPRAQGAPLLRMPVDFLALIDSQGRVRDLAWLEPLVPPAYVEATRAAMRSARFQAAQRAGRPVASRLRLKMYYTYE